MYMKFRLHRTMFMPTLENQGTEEQQKKYLEPARRYEIIGCYAQTEVSFPPPPAVTPSYLQV